MELDTHTLQSISTHPLTPFGLSILISTFIIGFAPRSSLLRFAGIVPEAYCVHFALKFLKETPLYPSFLSILVQNGTTLVFLAYLDSAILSTWTFEAQGPTSSLGGQTVLRKDGSKGGHDTVWNRLKFGFEQCFQARSAGTPWEVNNVPPFFRDRPGVVPTQRQFLYMTGKKILINVLLLDALGLASQYNGENTENFDVTRIPFFSRLGEVTTEELVSRIVGAVMYWVAGGIFLRACYDCIAFTVVGLGFGRIAHWPPLFGHFTQLWSLRQFWGSYWHQALRQKLSAPANFICFSVLRLQKGTFLSRYVLLTLVFFFSGLVHVMGDFAIGASWSESGAIRFFSIQAIGIMLEDSVQGIFRWINGEHRTAEPAKSWRAGVGYIWVLAWFTWTTSCFSNVSASRGAGEGILPFSLLEVFIK